MRDGKRHWQVTVDQVRSFWSRNEELCATISNTPSIVSRPTEYGPLIKHEGVLLSRRAGAVAHMNRVANGRLVAFPACFTRTEGTRPNTACDTAPAAPRPASTTRSSTRGGGIDSALVRRLAGEAIDAGELTGDLAKDTAVFTARAARYNLGAHAGGSGPPPPPGDVADRIVEHLVLGARARAFSAPIAAAMDLLVAGEPLEKAVEAALPAAASASASRGAAGEVVAGEAVAAAVVVAVAAAGVVVAAGAAGLMAAVAASGMLAVVRLVAEAQVMAAARALTGTGVVAVAVVVAAAAGVITAARLVAVVAAAGVMAVAGAVAVVGCVEALQRHRWKAAERCEVVRDLFVRLVFLLCGCGELPADLRWRVACAWHEGLEVGPKALAGMRALLGRRHQVAAACLFYESAIYDRRRQQQAAGAAATAAASSSSSSSSSQQERASAIASISVTSALRFMGDSLPVPSATFSWEWGDGALSLVQKVAREQYGPLQERLARSLVSPAVGPYCLLSNNCLDFADYVATGIMHRRQARKLMAVRAVGATAAVLAGPLMFAAVAAAAVAACGVAAAPGVGGAGGQGGGGAPATANSGAATGNNNADGDVAAARMLTYLEAACELY